MGWHTKVGGHGVAVERPELMRVQPDVQSLKCHVSDCLPQVVARELRVFPVERSFDTHVGEVGDE